MRYFSVDAQNLNFGHEKSLLKTQIKKAAWGRSKKRSVNLFLFIFLYEQLTKLFGNSAYSSHWKLLRDQNIVYGFFHYHKKTSSLRHIISFVLRHVICKCNVVVSMLWRISPFLAMTKLMFLIILRWSSIILYTTESKHVKFQAWTVLPF